MNKREPKFSAHWTLLKAGEKHVGVPLENRGIAVTPPVCRQVEVDAELETMVVRAPRFSFLHFSNLPALGTISCNKQWLL